MKLKFSLKGRKVITGYKKRKIGLFIDCLNINNPGEYPEVNIKKLKRF